MRHYTQLTGHQRYQIYALMKAEHNQTKIAAIVCVHKATVNREVRHNRGLKGYRSSAGCGTNGVPNRSAMCYMTGTGFCLSHEWIYQYVLHNKASGGELYRHLRCQRQRRKCYGGYSHRGQLKNTVSINQRPAIIERKARIGDSEVDTVIGKHHRQALVTQPERISMYTLITHIHRRTAAAVRQTIVRLSLVLKRPVPTITSDNGKEFAEHKIISEALNARFYFAHPYASWERGLNENISGLIRQYFPKKMDFSTITKKQVNRVMNKLNRRPRKTLDYRTPHEVLFNSNVVLQN
ncbi:MAG: IS30 family transposase [Gammaproteobacteria bacterium]